ncbi:WYL domain-containing transcriptional regulator [bacterium D16-76]|nr:WYL domain-containing transcriptional regulator [bacterium D16-76]
MNETNKGDRLLQIYSRLVSGQVLNKEELARQFGVSQRSIQRDMESLRNFLAEQHLNQELVYSRTQGGFYLQNRISQLLTNSEVLAVCKILLESRSLRRDEMLPMLDKLVENCVPEKNKALVKDLLSNEKYHYIEPHHGQSVLDKLWEIGQAVRDNRVMEIRYERMKEPKQQTRTIEPVGIMFSEYYFYLVAFLRDVDRKKEFENADDRSPTIYRIDRIRAYKVLDEKFFVPYSDRFEEGEFRKRVQFMYGGKLERVRFKYTGPSIEAVLDRLPTAQATQLPDGGWDVKAEVFGSTGIEMWLRSQGEYVQNRKAID